MDKTTNEEQAKPQTVEEQIELYKQRINLFLDYVEDTVEQIRFSIKDGSFISIPSKLEILTDGVTGAMAQTNLIIEINNEEK